MTVPAPKSLFDEDAGLQPAALLRKRPQHRCFPVNLPDFKEQIFYRTPPDDCL